MCEGGSSDDLFRQKLQVPPKEDLAISLFQLNYSAIEGLRKCIEKNGDYNEKSPTADVIREIYDDYVKVMAHPGGHKYVALNWECSSLVVSQKTFANYKREMLLLTKAFIDRKHIVIYGDYATQALIADWDEKLFGPNIFVTVGSGAGRSEVRFSPQDLLACPSAQLNTLGSLADTGLAYINATVQFAIKDEYEPQSKRDAIKEYHCQLLTVMAGGSNPPRNALEVRVKVKGPAGEETGEERKETVKGVCGHVLLTYAKSEGHLLLAGPHWISLSQMEVNVQTVLSYAAKTESAAAAATLSATIEKESQQQQQQQQPQASYAMQDQALSGRMSAMRVASAAAPTAYPSSGSYASPPPSYASYPAPPSGYPSSTSFGSPQPYSASSSSAVQSYVQAKVQQSAPCLAFIPN